VLGQHLVLLVTVSVPISLLELFLILFILHESPKYLYLNKCDKEAAILALYFYQGSNCDVSRVKDFLIYFPPIYNL
jgi:hypothetical protein